MDLRTYRHGRNLSLDDMAKRLGSSVATISRWERGIHTPSISAIERIQRATDGAVSVADFMPANRVAAEPGVRIRRRFARANANKPEMLPASA